MFVVSAKNRGPLQLVGGTGHSPVKPRALARNNAARRAVGRKHHVALRAYIIDDVDLAGAVAKLPPSMAHLWHNPGVCRSSLRQ